MQNFRKIAKLRCPEICEPQNREINVSRKFQVLNLDFRVNYLHNREVMQLKILNIYEIQKQTCELSQITMLTSTKAEEMVK